ncbi:MAG: tetratricopeptide repeat protein, partial [Ktedonobacteraceae bacterium]|nr:tetratricopeptide repeat protein [Ktedonobacteraceae bacterium]
LDHARVYTPDRVEGRLSAEQLRIARLLELLGECTRFQGKFEDARGFYEQVLDLRKRQSISGDSDEYRYEAQVQALLWCEIGVTWYNFGQNRGVLECFQQGEQVLKGAGIIAGPAWAYIRYMQSHVSGREGAYEKARHTAEEALKLFEETLKRKEYTIDHIRYPTLISRILMGDPVNLGRTHRLLAAIAVSDGHSEESLDHLRTALTLFEEHDSKRDIAIVCCNLGDLHIRKAEYDSAQSFFRRALSIAERIGDTQSVYVALNNEGVLAARLGNLLEAESWYERGLTLARGVNDPAYMSILYTYLAIVLQDQGRFEAARKSLREALSIGHTFRIAPCVGFALTTLGYVRFVSARFMIETNTEEHSNGLRILKQARNVLMKAIAMEGLEAETRTEGRLILSQVLLLMGSVDEAQLVAFQALEESSKFELLWLVAQAKRILGKISDVCSKKEESAQQFEQARRTFSKTGMRLEHARTLCEYGEVLLKWYEGDVGRKGEQEYRRGLDYVRESVKIFRECGAELDLKLAERVMERYKVTEKA